MTFWSCMITTSFDQIAEWDYDYEIEAVFSDCSEDDIIKDEIIDNNYYLPNRKETFMDLSGIVFDKNETLEVVKRIKLKMRKPNIVGLQCSSSNSRNDS